MMRSMIRTAVAGCMALAALSAVAVLNVGSSTAEAAPSVSPFAGSYVGYVPGSNGSMSVTISDGGRISGSLPDVSGTFGGYSKGSMSGRVADDGSFSLTVSVTYWAGEELQGRRWKSIWITSTSESTGTMALDPDGNIIGTPDAGPTGGTFVWTRQ